MIKYCFIFTTIALLSCNVKSSSQLELSFTSKNQDTITELKSFSLTKMPMISPTRNTSFKNIKCVAPNKFIFSALDTGTYFGLLQIEYRGATYNITIDSIKITPGSNSISKELNLGTVRLF